MVAETERFPKWKEPWTMSYNGFSDVELKMVSRDGYLEGGYEEGVYIRAISFSSDGEAQFLVLENDGALEVGKEFTLHMSAFAADANARMIMVGTLCQACTDKKFARGVLRIEKFWHLIEIGD